MQESGSFLTPDSSHAHNRLPDLIQGLFLQILICFYKIFGSTISFCAQLSKPTFQPLLNCSLPEQHIKPPELQEQLGYLDTLVLPNYYIYTLHLPPLSTNIPQITELVEQLIKQAWLLSSYCDYSMPVLI